MSGSRTRTFPRKPLALAIACLACAPAFADDNDVITLDTLSVWSTEIRASSVNLDGENMAARQADHISDLLRPIPGVDVGGAHSLNQRITIRNMDDKDLRISIDGANQNTYMYHHMGNLQINADILKSVEVDVGNNSVVNGGLGGAVRFETKTARELLREGERYGARAQLNAGDNDYTGASVTGYGQLTDTLDVIAYYNHLDRGNFAVGGNEIKDAEGNEIAGTDGTVRGLEGELDNALLKTGWDITPSQRLSLGYETYEDSGDYAYRPDMGMATTVAIAGGLGTPLVFPTEFTRDTVTLNHEWEVSDNTNVRSALFRNESVFWRDENGLAQSANARIAGMAGIKEGEAINTGINVLATTVLTGAVTQELRYGTDIIDYDTGYDALYLDGEVEKAGETADSKAVFVENRIGLTDRIALIPGLRHERYSIDSAVVDDSFSDTTGAFAAEFEPVQSVLLRASSTQLFKGPEISEVFNTAGLYDEPNAEIKAETGTNHELAAAFRDKVLGADNFSAGVTVFETTVKDYIYDYAETDVFYGKDNVGNMKTDGYEAYAGYDIGNLRTLLTYSVAESELEALALYADLDGARLDRQQGDTLTLEADYLIEGVNVALHWDVMLVDDVEADVDLDGATKDTAKDGYTVHNLSARWTPAAADGLVLTAGVDNLFDEYYASQSSRTGVSAHPVFGDLYLMDYEPGRNVKVTAAYQF